MNNVPKDDIRLSVERLLNGQRRYCIEVRRAGSWSSLKGARGELLLFESAAAAHGFMRRHSGQTAKELNSVLGMRASS
ncbi:MAG: hypothetical protein LBB66_04520 [Desulfovibrio sp.]|jgi:hypothetical protein|nr:hypothetical protein [Desulfovibrio sp.]